MRREVKSSQSTQMRNCKQVGDQRTCVGRWLAYAKRHFSMLILPRSELPRVSPDLLCHGLDASFPGHACRGHDHGHALSAETCHGHDFCNRTLELMNRCNDSCSFIRRALEARWIVKHESAINSSNKGRKWLSQSPSRSILVPSVFTTFESRSCIELSRSCRARRACSLGGSGGMFPQEILRF